MCLENKGNKFTCIKSGKKLVWSKGVSTKSASGAKTSDPSPSPTPSPSVAPSVTPSPSPSPSNTQASNQNPSPSPTPSSNWVDPLVGKPCTNIYEKMPNQIFELVCIPYKENHPGSNDTTLYWAQNLHPGNFNFPSPAPITLKNVVYMAPTVPSLNVSTCQIKENSTVRADLPTGFPRIAPRTPNSGTLKWALIPVDFADLPGDKDFKKRVFDFTGIKTANFILPKGQRIVPESGQGFPWDKEMKITITQEGALDSFTILGSVFDVAGQVYWQYWTHEFGHAIGIPHVGTSRISTPFQALELMGSDAGPARDLAGWLRYVAGWLEDDQVYCQDSTNLKTTELTLVPLNDKTPGVKMAVIKISDEKAVIVESRRVTKFGCTPESYREGVLVYSYDATKGHNEEMFKHATPADRKFEKAACFAPETQDPLLRTGDKVTIEGITIEVIMHGTLDQIRITK